MRKKTLRTALRGVLPVLASLLFLGRAPAQTYCIPTASGYTQPICTVNFAGINQSSPSAVGGNTPYIDYTSGTAASVAAGSTYPILVNANTDGGYTSQLVAFFDWNGDGTFETTAALGPLNNSDCSNNPGISSTITVPPGTANGTARMRVVAQYYYVASDPCAAVYYGQAQDFTVTVGPPPTCLVPTALQVTNILAHTATLGWTASTSNPSGGYLWEVRSSGAAGSGATGLMASGTTAGTTASVSGLTANTPYTLYVQADCGGGDFSAWASKAFTTSLGCGATWISPGGVANLTDQQFYVNTFTVCPDNAGDVVTLNFTMWNGLNWNVPQRSGIFIYDGPNTSSPLIAGPGTAYTEGSYVMPAGGWTSIDGTNKPPTTSASPANGGCLTIAVYSYGIWTGGMGWSADFTCAPPPTCLVPTNRTVSGITVHTANLSWNPGASPNVEYKVVAGGGTSASPAVAGGTSASGTATVTGLTANTPYSVFFRGICSAGADIGPWTSAGLNFRTKVGCGGSYDLYNSATYAAYIPIPTGGRDSVLVICPDNAGDVVTLTVPKFSFGTDNSAAVGLFVHDGNSTAAPIFNSGLPSATYGAYTLAAGAFRGTTYRNTPGNPGTSPGPFTSTAANGCLTLHFQAFNGSTYDQGMQSNVTCAAAPACSTPNNLVISNIGGTSATVSWGNTSGSCIVEYGPVGFTPGIGATAGTNGTVISGATSPTNITGLTGLSNYQVYVRQVCGGPSYSANSFKGSFTTSMDCSTAQVISCGQYLSDASAPAAYAFGDAAYSDGKYTGAVSCLGGGGNANGPERLYRFTASAAGTYGIVAGISDQGTSPIGYVITPVANGCAASAFTCIGSVNANTGGILNFTVSTPGDYYIMSDANYVVHTRPFTLGCPGIPGCAAAPTTPANGTMLAVNTNPIAFSWPAVFGATGYDIYFNGSQVASNYPSTSISSASYTTAAVKALVGLGNPVTWRVVPRNSFGTATCPTTWSFSVGGNGATNAVTLSNGVAKAGNVFTANGYSSQEATFWGNDSWFKFTAGLCADSAKVSLCLPAAEPATYLALVVRRASDNAVVFPPANDASYYAYVTSGGCFQYSWFNNDPLVWNWVNETPKFAVSAGETYYVIADGYSYGYNFTMAYNEVLNNTDSDGDGVPDCADSCPFTPGVEGGPCTPSSGFAVGQIVNCECVDGNMAVIKLTTDANPTQLTWQVTDGASTVIASGGPTALQTNTTVSQTVFLSGSCYGFKLMDSFGDGITNGGWELRTTDGKLILRDGFANGSASPANPPATASYGGAHSFCLPLGPVNIVANECGVFNSALGNKVYCNKPAGATQYEFEFSDPDAGFLRRVTVNRNYVIYTELGSSITPGVKYFARVRTNVAGPLASAHWGSGCEMGLGVAQVVTCSELIMAPAYGHSCNESRAFNTNNSFIYAKPVNGANEYQFRIYNLNEGYDQTFTRSTYILQLKWNSSVAPPLVNGSTYNVQINTKVNGLYTGFCSSSCTISINNALTSLEQASAFGEATMWPNPVSDGQVNLSIGGLQDADQRISVDVQDLYGKQVFAQEFGNSGDRFNTILQLPGDIASGVYLVNITVNGQRTVQRLSIVK